MSSSRLPKLLDHKTLREEMGIPRSTADAIFRELSVVTFPDPATSTGRHRKVYVKRADVEALIERSTFRNDGTEVRR